jgi:isopentenyl diphosphate isomerase/L-lactate dehydrogenase-like FMN-dependent dehydrogenase
VSMPLLVAPTALHCMAHPEGECATAQGAGAAGTLMIASTVSTRSLEEIAQAASGPLWFQLYAYPTLEVAAWLVKRAEAAGYQAIMLTVDLPALGNRERDKRHSMPIPPEPLIEANFIGVEKEGQQWLPLTWETVDWLRSITTLPILIKGILTAEDALLAVEHGVSGIVISNHGGRQLDSVVTGIEALPEVVEAVAGRCEVYVDGGIRRGTDILKALALGARAVLVGRPVLWGLAVNGAPGVQHILDLLHTELELAMKLSGCPTVASIKRSLVKLT